MIIFSILSFIPSLEESAGQTPAFSPVLFQISSPTLSVDEKILP